MGERKELEYMVGYNKLFMVKELEGRRRPASQRCIQCHVFWRRKT